MQLVLRASAPADNPHARLQGNVALDVENTGVSTKGAGMEEGEGSVRQYSLAVWSSPTSRKQLALSSQGQELFVQINHNPQNRCMYVILSAEQCNTVLPSLWYNYLLRS